MDLKQLQYFVVCAQTGSFSDAAKNLYSTQPSVSKVIEDWKIRWECSFLNGFQEESD